MYIDDTNTGNICSPSAESSSSSTPYGYMTMETPLDGSLNVFYLPKFSSPNYFYNGAVNSYRIDNSAGVCPCQNFFLYGTNGTNIHLAVDTYSSPLQGYFSETWTSSAGT